MGIDKGTAIMKLQSKYQVFIFLNILFNRLLQ